MLNFLQVLASNGGNSYNLCAQTTWTGKGLASVHARAS